jgi:uncharacterized protein (DUF983 family)
MSMQHSDRPALPALKLGLAGRCPHCGEGRLFRAFLKPAAACERCGERYEGRHRADDFPAYIVIFIVGHIVVPMFLLADRDVHWPLWIHMTLWPSLVLALSLLLLQPVKGALIGLQWALRMHDFADEGGSRERGEPA